MFCEHYILPLRKNIGGTKTYFPTFPFHDCFVFHLITLLLKDFLVLGDILKPACEKRSKENSQQISKNNQIISPYRTEIFASKNDNERKINCMWPNTMPNTIIYLKQVKYLNIRLRQIYYTNLELQIRCKRLWIKYCNMVVRIQECAGN